MLLVIAAWGLLAVLAAVALWPERRAAGSLVPAASERTTAQHSRGALALARRIARRGRPTELALFLALLSLPIVALTLGTTTTPPPAPTAGMRRSRQAPLDSGPPQPALSSSRPLWPEP